VLISAEDDNAGNNSCGHEEQDWQSKKKIPLPVEFLAVLSRSFVEVTLADLPFKLLEVTKTCVESLFVSWWEV
jgi:hypothetical protein